MNRYCVGPAMAIDWGEGDTELCPADRRRMMARVLSYFRPYWRPGLLVVACIAIQAVLGLAPAVVFKSLIDTLARPHPSFAHVGLLVAAGIGAALAGGLTGVGEAYLSTRISQGIVATLRRELFGRLLDQPVGFFTDRKAGDLLSRINTDIDGVEDVVTDTVFGLVSSVLVTVATLALMLRFSWQLTLAVLVMIPLVALPARRAGRATYQARARTQSLRGQLTGYLQETLGISGIMLVKAFGREPDERQRFAAINAELRNLEVRQNLIGQWFGMLMSALQTAGPALMMVTTLASMHVNISGSLALFRRLFTYIDRVPEIADNPGARELAPVTGAIFLDQVTFSYPGAARPAVADLTVHIEPGQMAALVGPTGAGKTTITGLVARFHEPQHGRILIDGTDLREVTRASLARQLGIVFQDTFLFHASIAENLRYARPGASDAELAIAAEAAHLHEFICALPDGYDTVVGERGHRLSGGEKQRLAIARVILRRPMIVILDEATSHLDSVSEHHVQAALAVLLRGRTALVIAHRLSTILAADTIIVIDQGRLVDQGTHPVLLARGGLYAELYHRQFRAERTPAAEPAPSVAPTSGRPSFSQAATTVA